MKSHCFTSSSFIDKKIFFDLPLKPIAFAISLSFLLASCGTGPDELNQAGAASDLDLGSALQSAENAEASSSLPSQSVQMAAQQSLQETESESGFEQNFQTESQTISLLQPGREPDAQSVPVPEAQTESESDREPQPTFGVDADADSLPETETVPESDAVAQTEPEPQAQPEPEIQPEPEVQAEPELESGGSTSIDELIQVDLRNLACDADPGIVGAALLELTNQSRQQSQVCGSSVHQAVAPLEWDESLSRAALSHSVDMSTHNFFSHTGSDGSSSFQRAVAEGFPSMSVGENIAAGQRTTGAVQDGWMGSPGHCQNIMRSSYTHMGASCVLDEGVDFTRYWTVVFGRR